MNIDISNFKIDIFSDEIQRQFNYKHEDIFQQMCFDLLSYNCNDVNFISFPTAGKDGSIDHYGFNSNDHSIIVECKKNDTFELAQSSLKTLWTKLKKTLSDSKAKNNLYKPWFNKNLKEYHFCTSASVSTAKYFDEFKDEIKNMLNELSTIAELEHLSKVSVKLYTWNNLSSILEKDSLSYYKWIKNDIRGIDYLNDLPQEKSIYKQNLYNSKLPFISRESYNLEYPDNTLKTEKEIFETIFLDDSLDDGILIYGEGGIGKTRLMLEFGYMALKENWIVLKVTKKLNSLENLKLRPNEKYCLLIDYIEENIHFTADILDNLNDMYPQSIIKIIANCRSSYLLYNSLPTDFYKYDITPNKNYLLFVTSEILKGLDLDEDFFKVKPSFAVFIKEDLHNNKKVQKNFRQYIKDRLCTTLNKNDFIDIENKTLSTLASLSFSECDEVLKKELKPLKRDGWVSIDDNEEYSSEHDTIIDELVELYLEQEKFDNEDRLDEIKNFIKNSKNIYSTFRTLDRISLWLFKENIADFKFFTNLIKSLEYMNFDLINLISKTSLIDEKHRFDIFVEKKEQYKDYIENFLFIFPLSFAINQQSKNKSKDTNIEQILEIWIEKNLKNIAEYKVSFRIISTILKSYGLEHSISGMTSSWLEKYPKEMETSFVLQSWLNAKGDVKLVEKYIEPWLEKYPKELETHFVITAWLNAKGDIKLVEKYIEPWLEKYPKELETSFVLRAWLDAKGDVKLVEKYIEPWLEKHPKELETDFVIKAWLDAKGDVKLVEKYIEPWLEKYHKELETHFVITAWLDAKGDVKLVEKYIEPWLEKYPKELETSFVLRAWLDAKGDVKLVEKYIEPWLEKYPKELETSFVLRAWLDAKGDVKLVEKYIEPWLEKFADEDEASFVIKAFLKAKYELSEKLLGLIFNWLITNQKNNDIDFVLKRVYKIPNHKLYLDIPEEVFNISFDWCERNIESKEVLYMLSYMSNYTKLFSQYPIVSRKVLEKYRDINLSKFEIESYEYIIYNFYVSIKNKAFRKDEDIYLLIKWLFSNKSFDEKSNNLRIKRDMSYYNFLYKLLDNVKNIDTIKVKKKIELYFKN